MAEQNLDQHVHEEGAQDSGETVVAAYSGIDDLIATLFPDGAVDLPGLNKAMDAAIRGKMPISPEVLFTAVVQSHQDLWFLLADTVVTALDQLGALPQGYEQTMLNLHVAYEHLHLRALYNLLSERELSQ